MFQIMLLSHVDLAVATQIHAIQMLAYRQEAALIGVESIPPLEWAVDVIQNSRATFLGAFEHAELLGSVGVQPDDEDRGVNISSLVVAPAHQRRGVGRALLAAAIAASPRTEVTVQTSAKNSPALALYAEFGFAEYKRWVEGSEPVELVKLSRPP